mgnify:CR=1 FL=1
MLNCGFRFETGLGSYSSMEIIITDTGGTVHRFIDGVEGQSLMELARQHGVEGIMADCGGACSCATCHVFIAPEYWEKVGEPDEVEFAMLDMVADVSQPTSRLSCQIKLSEALDGLKITVAPNGGM